MLARRKMVVCILLISDLMIHRRTDKGLQQFEFLKRKPKIKGSEILLPLVADRDPPPDPIQPIRQC